MVVCFVLPRKEGGVGHYFTDLLPTLGCTFSKFLIVPDFVSVSRLVGAHGSFKKYVRIYVAVSQSFDTSPNNSGNSI